MTTGPLPTQIVYNPKCMRIMAVKTAVNATQSACSRFSHSGFVGTAYMPTPESRV
jgi:hypothetical protein